MGRLLHIHAAGKSTTLRLRSKAKDCGCTGRDAALTPELRTKFVEAIRRTCEMLRQEINPSWDEIGDRVTMYGNFTAEEKQAWRALSNAEVKALIYSVYPRGLARMGRDAPPKADPSILRNALGRIDFIYRRYRIVQVGENEFHVVRDGTVMTRSPRTLEAAKAAVDELWDLGLANDTMDHGPACDCADCRMKWRGGRDALKGLTPEEDEALHTMFRYRPWGKDKVSRAVARYLDGDEHALDMAPTIKAEIDRAIVAMEKMEPGVKTGDTEVPSQAQMAASLHENAAYHHRQLANTVGDPRQAAQHRQAAVLHDVAAEGWRKLLAAYKSRTGLQTVMALERMAESASARAELAGHRTGAPAEYFDSVPKRSRDDKATEERAKDVRASARECEQRKRRIEKSLDDDMIPNESVGLAHKAFELYYRAENAFSIAANHFDAGHEDLGEVWAIRGEEIMDAAEQYARQFGGDSKPRTGDDIPFYYYTVHADQATRGLRTNLTHISVSARTETEARKKALLWFPPGTNITKVVRDQPVPSGWGETMYDPVMGVRDKRDAYYKRGNPPGGKWTEEWAYEVARGGCEQEVDTEGMDPDSIYDACINAGLRALKEEGCPENLWHVARRVAQDWAQP